MIKEILRLMFVAIMGNTLLRLYGLLLYPIAYYNRYNIRYVKTDSVEDRRYCMYHKWHWLWIVLDDSVFLSYGQDCNRKYIPSFWASYKWSVWRNSCVNFWNWNAVGRLEDGQKVAPYFRLGKHKLGDRIRFKIFIKDIDLFILKVIVRQIDVGWSDGSGRFEMKVRIVQ